MEKLQDLLSRKFLYAITVVTMAFILVLQEKVSAESFLTFCGVIGATYIIGNISARSIESKSTQQQLG